MVKEVRLPTMEDINEWVSYDKETGVFTWKKDRPRRFKAGDRAGVVNGVGYEWMSIPCCRRLYSHRIAWFIENSAWPKHDIDHINGDKLDNRIANLREATRSQNNQNRWTKSPNKSTDMIGVSKRSDYEGYDARISVNGKQRCLGTFKTAEEARKAYLAEKEKLHEYRPIKT